MAMTLSGCLTGTLIESGRLHERVSRYEHIAIDGHDLVLDYTVEISKSAAGTGAARGRSERRSAILSIKDLDTRPPYPTDAFPIRRVPPRPRVATPLQIRISSHGAGDDSTGLLQPNSAVSGAPVSSLTPAAPKVEVTERAGRHLGFRVCPGEVDRGMTRVRSVRQRNDCLGFFYSAVLCDDHLAWWIYPRAPFTIAIDVALLPIQLVTLPPLLLVSD
jgi:hypothetical protein